MRRVIAIVAAVMATTTLRAEVAVAHPSVPVAQLVQDELRDTLLGRTKIWDGGVPVVLVLSRERSDDDSMTEISGRDLNRLLRGWKRLAFSGAGQMPQVVSDRQAAIAAVASTRGAVTILDLPEEVVLPEGLQRVRLEPR